MLYDEIANICSIKANMGGTQVKRKIWSKEDTLLFLSCYAARKSEFLHPRKKKYAFANVLEDMVYKGFNDATVTVRALDAKMRTLLTAYKTGKDHNRASGAAPCTVPYMEEMDEIFGDRPVIQNEHSTSFGAMPNDCGNQTSVHARSAQSSSIILSTQTFDEFFEFTPSSPKTTIASAPVSVAAPLPTAMIVSSPVSVAAPIKHHRKTAKEKFYDARLRIMQESRTERQNFMKEIKETFIEISERQLNTEERKIKLLEELLKK